MTRLALVEACSLSLALASSLAGCWKTPTSNPTGGSVGDIGKVEQIPVPPSFEEEVAFLRKYGSILVLERPDGGRIAVSAQYQARVMTSAVARGAPSLGFIHHKFIEAGKVDTQFDNYGGEDRFWLGPEGGQYGLFFAPGKPFVMANWQTPNDLQRGAWAARKSDPTHVVFDHDVDVTNYGGARFHALVTRDLKLLDASDVASNLGVTLSASVQWVGFESDNMIESREGAWSKDAGLLSIWILSMYNPSPDTQVIIPFSASPAKSDDIVNDRYFGKVPADRLAINTHGGYLVFKCDGTYRSKIGLGPTRAKSVLGSYSASARLLTIVQYNKPDGGAASYVNSMWETQANPYGGDVVNSYNDGPTEPGKPSLGGFYEVETSSPGAQVPGPGTKVQHVQRTFHFVGEPNDLNLIAMKVLGVSLLQLK